jgi:hypothetical protein
MRNAGLTWETLTEIRSWSSLPLVLKGILTADDARLAVEYGAAGVWASNHGGRQLDRSPAPIDVLDEVIEAVDGRAEVYLDGGVRRGTEVVTALATGARAAFTALPLLYALACAGEPGWRRRSRSCARRLSGPWHWSVRPARLCSGVTTSGRRRRPGSACSQPAPIPGTAPARRTRRLAGLDDIAIREHDHMRLAAARGRLGVATGSDEAPQPQEYPGTDYASAQIGRLLPAAGWSRVVLSCGR